MPGNKTSWTKPQLIVLAKGTPKESVLTHCKTENPGVPVSTGAQDLVQHDRCAAGQTVNNCSNCQSRAFNET
jgi:hypothetical protein